MLLVISAKAVGDTRLKIGVFVSPGATPATRNPKGANSKAQVRVSASNPAFDALNLLGL